MKDYHDGPIPYEKRSCTDIICLIIFCLLTAFLLIVAVYAWSHSSGNFKKLTVAYDVDGKGCGIDYPNFPYVYFVSPHIDSLWVTVCVSKCPVQTDTQLQCQTNSVVTSCQPRSDSNNTKTVQIYDSSITANTLCLPTSHTLQNVIAPAISSNGKMVTGIMNGWVLIIVSIPIAIVLALIVMLIIRFFAGCFIQLLIAVAVIALFALGIYIWFQPAGSAIGSVALFQNNTIKIIAAILCFLLALAIIVFICCFRNRIALAQKIVEVSAVFVASQCMIVLVPLVLFIVTLLFIFLWILEGLGYYSLGVPTFKPQQYPYQHFQLTGTVQALIVTHIFYLFWTVIFLIETSNFLICGTASSWYFKRESPYGQTSQRYRGKHIGSVLMGAFLQALIGFIKFMYTLLAPDEKTEHQGVVQYYRKCCDICCCLCIGKLFDWFNAGAYTWINMAGDSYCTSGVNSVAIRAKNLASTGVLSILSVVFTILIRIGITALTVLTIYLIIQNTATYSTQIQDASLLLIVVGLIAFAISCFFISVYSESMEALYTTYLMDVDAGMDGGNCPDQLRDFINQAQLEEHMIPANSSK